MNKKETENKLMETAIRFQRVHEMRVRTALASSPEAWN